MQTQGSIFLRLRSKIFASKDYAVCLVLFRVPTGKQKVTSPENYLIYPLIGMTSNGLFIRSVIYPNKTCIPLLPICSSSFPASTKSHCFYEKPLKMRARVITAECICNQRTVLNLSFSLASPADRTQFTCSARGSVGRWFAVGDCGSALVVSIANNDLPEY